jgi:threonine dehydratase
MHLNIMRFDVVPQNEGILSKDTIAEAEIRIRSYLAVTPLRNYPLLDQYLGNELEVWIKLENHHPTNNFKIRNVISALTALPHTALGDGVITASTGSHGLALAWAASQLKTKATICLPVSTPATKVEAIQAYGAHILCFGNTYDEALAYARSYAAKTHTNLIEATNNINVLAGAATITLEVLRQKPDLDAMVLAIGGGSHAAGAVSVLRDAERPQCTIFGVQASQASAIHDSWVAKQPMIVPAQQTIAEGLGTSNVYDATFKTLLDGLTGFVTVTELEIIQAIKNIIIFTGNLVEGAGAVGLAGLYRLRGKLAGKRVVVVLTGANPSFELLSKVFSSGSVSSMVE